jgi:hypothetical protein
MAPCNKGEEYNAGSKKRRHFRNMLQQELEEDMAKEQPLDDDEAVDKQDERQDQRAKQEETKKAQERQKEGQQGLYFQQ